VLLNGSKKLNISESQREKLRQEIARDPTKFHTYSSELLSIAFPPVNDKEIKVKER
jgi:hypothetical protein